jgi:hypothetical protein
VGDQGATVQQLDDIGGDIGEGRLVLQHLGRQAVDVGGTGIDAGIEQADHGMFDAPLGVQRQRGQADDAGVTRPETRGLDVDDHPAIPRLAGGSTPGVAHTVRMTRRSDSARDIESVSARRVHSA